MEFFNHKLDLILDTLETIEIRLEKIEEKLEKNELKEEQIEKEQSEQIETPFFLEETDDEDDFLDPEPFEEEIEEVKRQLEEKEEIAFSDIEFSDIDLEENLDLDDDSFLSEFYQEMEDIEEKEKEKQELEEKKENNLESNQEEQLKEEQIKEEKIKEKEFDKIFQKFIEDTYNQDSNLELVVSG